MQQLLNTLYVMTPQSYVRLDHETLRVEADGKTALQVPLHHLGALVCFGNVLLSPALIHRCAEDGRSVVWLEESGRFKGRLEGPTSGNVLLRRAQHEALSDAAQTASIARNMIAGKVQNSRQVLLRGGREAEDPADIEGLKKAAEVLASVLERLPSTSDLDTLRGLEGEAARAYFAAFSHMVRVDRSAFQFNRRSRRPPLDRTNALLSFLYALLLIDCVAAAEGVGLDPQMGFLHALRPGRAALGLDLMEELRPILADRLALTLINRRQLTAKDFVERPGGAVHLREDSRKTVVVAYQERKRQEVQHPVVERKTPLGLVHHVQARLLARVLRGDMEEYLPFLYR